MSGKKNYRLDEQVRKQIKREENKKAAEALAQAEIQKKITEEKIRAEEQARERERKRLRQVAEAEAAKKEQDRQTALALENESILRNCEIEMNATQHMRDPRFSIGAITQALEEIRVLAAKKTEVDLVREAESRFKLLLTSHLGSVAEFKRHAAEWEDLNNIIKANQNVRIFLGKELGALVEKHEAIVQTHSLKESGPLRAIDALKEITKDASALLMHACQLSAEYDSRNKLLEATIASLKSMGFYVNDPSFLDAKDPCGLVTLSANRAGERIVINIPLSGEIESNWQEIMDSACIKDFHAFLAKLKDAGFPCETSVPNLPPPDPEKEKKPLPGDVRKTRGA